MDLDEITICSRVLKGETQEFSKLVTMHQVAVRGYCRAILRDVQEAEDAAQESFLKAFKSLSGFQQNSSFKTWVLAIASNHCRDVLRKKKRRKLFYFGSLSKADTREKEDYLSNSKDPLLKREIEDHLRHLNAEQTQALVLKEVNGLRYSEIAGIMNCSVDSVKARLKRARSLLKTIGESNETL